MASDTGRDTRHGAIPLPRLPLEQERIDSDDALVESIGTGHSVGPDDDPLMRLLVAWRAEVVGGR